MQQSEAPPPLFPITLSAPIATNPPPPPPRKFTFVGSHLDTNDPFDGMKAIKERMPIPKGGVQVRRGHALCGG